MQPVAALINHTEPGWPLVRGWIDSAKNKVQVLPADTGQAIEALFRTQVTTRSPMGAIIYTTGGILVDHGWIRILGSGSPRLSRSLPDWNLGRGFKQFGEQPSFLLIADDAAGGFFALNGGAFGQDAGKVYYLSPDHLEWEPLDITYSGFLDFCFNGDLADFYSGIRWENWQQEVAGLDGSQTFSFFPPLWTREAKQQPPSRKTVPVAEQYHLQLDFRKQLNLR